MNLTGRHNYFEDFAEGQLFRHARGRTIGEHDNVSMALQALNTCAAHFNAEARPAGDQAGAMEPGAAPARRVFEGVTIAMVIGLTMQDTGENAVKELRLDRIRLPNPVLHGDTLYAFSEVMEVRDAEIDDAGIVTFRHYGFNQDDRLVFEGERTVLLKRRSHYLKSTGP